MTEEKKELLAEILNSIFPSDEDNGVEHIDMSYKEFVRKLKELASYVEILCTLYTPKD